MDNLHFSNEAIAGLLTESLLQMILPIVLLVVWKIKTHEKIFPVFIGAVTWLLFAIILKIAPAYLLLQADNPLAKTISGNIWLTMLVAGILAGLFEETGRFLAFRYVLKKYDQRRSAISYGIGHGGFESMYIGFQCISIPFMGIMINSGMGGLITAGADEATTSLLVSQLEAYSSVTFPDAMLGTFERIPAVAVHIAFSVLVFAAVKNRKQRYLYPLAILLHTLMDFSIVLYQAEMVPLWAMELILVGYAAAVGYFALKVYRKLGNGSRHIQTDAAESD